MAWGSPRMLIAFTVATFATVGVVVVLVTKAWWALPIAMAGHLVSAGLVMRPIARAMGQQDKPDPLAEARLEEEGRAPTGERPEDATEGVEGTGETAVEGTEAAREGERRMAI